MEQRAILRRLFGTGNGERDLFTRSFLPPPATNRGYFVFFGTESKVSRSACSRFRFFQGNSVYIFCTVCTVG